MPPPAPAPDADGLRKPEKTDNPKYAAAYLCALADMMEEDPERGFVGNAPKLRKIAVRIAELQADNDALRGMIDGFRAKAVESALAARSADHG